MTRTFTAQTLRAAQRPTFYFVGVTTGQSSIRRVFPAWAEALALGDVEMTGIDLPLHAPDEDYRAVVEFLARDPLSLGALVTTHKIDLFRAASDLFDEVDPLAALMGELSCIAKREGRIIASAKDPYSAGHALEALLPDQHFARNPQAEVFLMGAGGSAIAIDWYLTRPERGVNRPATVVVSNRSQGRLDALKEIHERAGDHRPLRTVLASDARSNDAILRELPEGSLVVNATGLGKDAPGSPLTDDAVFPNGAAVWELNYRGDLVFLDQARRQADERGLRVVDGWVYFLHGWTQVIGDVFDVDIPTRGPAFEQLSQIAAGFR
ncbi:shikimate dehydrogenase [Microbacterium sp. PRC9]|uniref:shikimate dehydrogenase family protein n=1 Tax=Microbacterium sp. PRC9 TaxID=2962591 RepID=UPI00288164F6|nr:shikimate dehydrogenase [Microbacterium sp. PRC9]MDT0144520.1 shikimate dehydrogenase [Microbacterium sp. PRC9]